MMIQAQIRNLTDDELKSMNPEENPLVYIEVFKRFNSADSADSSADSAAEYERGLEEGREEGRDEGYDQGYEEGKNSDISEQEISALERRISQEIKK